MRWYSFEGLDAWKRSRDFVGLIYRLTSQFPPAERFGLALQLRRAVVSISSNISEGTGRTSLKDQAHFTQMSYASLMEVLNQTILCYDLDYIKEEDYEKVREEIDKLSALLQKLRASQLKRLNA